MQATKRALQQESESRACELIRLSEEKDCTIRALKEEIERRACFHPHTHTITLPSRSSSATVPGIPILWPRSEAMRGIARRLPPARPLFNPSPSLCLYPPCVAPHCCIPLSAHRLRGLMRQALRPHAPKDAWRALHLESLKKRSALLPAIVHPSEPAVPAPSDEVHAEHAEDEDDAATEIRHEAEGKRRWVTTWRDLEPKRPNGGAAPLHELSPRAARIRPASATNAAFKRAVRKSAASNERLQAGRWEGWPFHAK